MKITVSVSHLAELLDLVTRFVSKHATLPILENVYLKANIDTVLLRATDMEKFIEIQMPAKIDAEGAVTVNAKTLYDLVRTIETETMVMQLEGDSVLSIKTAADSFDIKGISASEYVALPDMPAAHKVGVATEVFSRGIEKVEYAVTEKSFTPVLTGVLLRVDTTAHKVTFVGTDSFRLAEYAMDFDGTADKNVDMIIPKTHINDIKRVADYATEKGQHELTISYADNLVAFHYEVEGMQIITTSLLIQGNFPEYRTENIMPTKFNGTIKLSKDACEKAIKKISILTKDINNYIAFATQGDALTVSSGDTDKGAGNTSIAAIVDGERANFGLNGKFVSDFMRNVKSQDVVFNVVSATTPLVLTDPDDSNYRYVVRPLMQ